MKEEGDKTGESPSGILDLSGKPKIFGSLYEVLGVKMHINSKMITLNINSYRTSTFTEVSYIINTCTRKLRNSQIFQETYFKILSTIYE